MATSTLENLRKATEGLLYPSETDAPFEVSESATPFMPPANAPVEGCVLADLFDPGDREFVSLCSAIQQSLTDIRVFRIGKITITLIITGKTPANTYITLETVSVETG